jgi:hypothetical protein
VRDIKGGGSVTTLKIPIENAEPIGINFGHLSYAGIEGAVESCKVDASISDGSSVWSRKGSTTVVNLVTRGYPNNEEKRSTLEIHKKPDAYEVVFSNVWVGYCSWGELPKRIAVKKGQEECAVEK